MLPTSDAGQSAQVLILQQAKQPIDEWTAADGIRFMHHYRWLISGWGLGLGVAGAVASLVLITPEFEASATVVVSPPPVNSTISPHTLSVQSYQRLIESDAVVADLRARLMMSGDLDATAPLQVGNQLSTALYLSKKDEGVSLAPMLQLSARNHDAERAARIANAWAEVFFARVRSLTAGTTDSSVAFVDQQFQQLRTQLAAAESASVAAADDIQGKQAALSLEWDRKVADATQDAARAKATYQNTTKQLVEQFMSGKNLQLRIAVADANLKAIQEIQTEVTGINSRLEMRQTELASAKERLAETPAGLISRRAVTDDAVWQSISSGRMSTEERKRFLDQGMFSEVPNPAHADMVTRVANLEIDVAALTPREAKLRADLATKSAVLKAEDTALRTDQVALDELTRGREIGLQSLAEDLSLKEATLKRERDLVIQGFNRQAEIRQAAIHRGLAQEKTLYEQFAKYQSEAVIAKAQENRQDVQLAVPAVAPTSPKASRRSQMAVIAGILGLLIGVGHAVVRGALRQPKKLPLMLS